MKDIRYKIFNNHFKKIWTLGPAFITNFLSMTKSYSSNELTLWCNKI
jgi:hypothetical protein